MQISGNEFACKFQRILQMGQRVIIRFWWESGLSSASRNCLTTFCGLFAHYVCLRLSSAIVHFIQNNCLYSVCYGWSAQTSSKRWFWEHEYDVKLWHHKQCKPNTNDTIRHWMNPPYENFLRTPLVSAIPAAYLLIDCCTTRHSRSLVFWQLWTALT